MMVDASYLCLTYILIMASLFTDFDFAGLWSQDPAIRNKAELQSSQAKQHPLEYCQYLTQEITTTNDSSRASMGFMVLKMVISEVKLPAASLLKMLEYYSERFIRSRQKSCVKPFAAFMEALLLQIDSIQETFPRPTKGTLPSGPCYLHKENLLLEGKTSDLSVDLLLAFLNLYLQHIKPKNISLLTIRTLTFNNIYKKVKNINIQGNPLHLEQFKKLKGEFFISLLQNARKFNLKIFLEYFFVIPQRACEFGIDMIRSKNIQNDQSNKLLTFFLKNIIDINNPNAQSFLKQPLYTHLLFSKLLNFLIDRINKQRFPIEMDQEDLSSSSDQNKEQMDKSSSEGMIDEFSKEIVRIQEHQHKFYMWIFKVLMTHNTLVESEIFKFADPLNAVLDNLVSQDLKGNQFVDWMMGRLKEGQKGDQKFEGFCYYFYYLQGYFFKRSNRADIKQTVAKMALEDLTNLRFRNKNMCSVIYYLRMYIGTMNIPAKFHSQTIGTVLSHFSSYNDEEVSQAILACFVRDLKNYEDQTIFKQVTSYIWASISTAPQQKKQHILQNLRQRLEQEFEVDSIFLTDLLAMLNDSPNVFQSSFLAQENYVRMEYLRLISLSVTKIDDMECTMLRMTNFLQALTKSCLKYSIQVSEVLDIFASIFRRENRKTKDCIMPNSEIIKILIEEFKPFARYIIEHHPLLIEIVSFPYEQNQVSEVDVVKKLQVMTLEYLLSLEIDDRLCDILEIFFTLNQAAINEPLTAYILKKTMQSPNYYRMAYLLSPIPYPPCITSHIKLTQLKHYKWFILFVIGKFKPPSFSAISRSSRDQAADLVLRFEAMKTQLSTDETHLLGMLRDELEMFSKDDQTIMLNGIEESSMSHIFSKLYEERYQRSSIVQAIKQLLQGFQSNMQ